MRRTVRGRCWSGCVRKVVAGRLGVGVEERAQSDRVVTLKANALKANERMGEARRWLVSMEVRGCCCSSGADLALCHVEKQEEPVLTT